MFSCVLIAGENRLMPDRNDWTFGSASGYIIPCVLSAVRTRQPERRKYQRRWLSGFQNLGSATPQPSPARFRGTETARRSSYAPGKRFLVENGNRRVTNCAIQQACTYDGSGLSKRRSVASAGNGVVIPIVDRERSLLQVDGGASVDLVNLRCSSPGGYLARPTGGANSSPAIPHERERGFSIGTVTARCASPADSTARRQ